MDCPLLRSQADWAHGARPPARLPAQLAITWAQHLVLLFPLWLGDTPAQPKGLLEQVAQPGFAFKPDATNPFSAKALTDRSARVVVPMGMPAMVYGFYFRGHGVKSLERNVLGFVGMAPARETPIGGVDPLGIDGVARWINKLGQAGPSRRLSRGAAAAAGTASGTIRPPFSTAPAPTMQVVCLDLEGVLIPEIWIAFAERTGIAEFRRTTREEPDYDVLMRYRLALLRQHGLKLADIQAVIAGMAPMAGA